jgi:pyruvate kinase
MPCKYMKQLKGTDQMLYEVEKALLLEKIVKKGDHIVIISDSPLLTQAKTNFMKIHQIGE